MLYCLRRCYHSSSKISGLKLWTTKALIDISYIQNSWNWVKEKKLLIWLNIYFISRKSIRSCILIDIIFALIKANTLKEPKQKIRIHLYIKCFMMALLIRNTIRSIYKLKQKCCKKIDRIMYIWSTIWIKRRRSIAKSNITI